MIWMQKINFSFFAFLKSFSLQSLKYIMDHPNDIKVDVRFDQSTKGALSEDMADLFLQGPFCFSGCQRSQEQRSCLSF